jgi:hypothetical protein
MWTRDFVVAEAADQVRQQTGGLDVEEELAAGGQDHAAMSRVQAESHD